MIALLLQQQVQILSTFGFVGAIKKIRNHFLTVISNSNPTNCKGRLTTMYISQPSLF
jgi:hypothetical protein